MRHYRPIDQVFIGLQSCLQTLLKTDNIALRNNPAEHVMTDDLTQQEKRHSAGLMRINHTGEVCAQALYIGQSMTASLPLRQVFQTAAQEEKDHLQWCQERLNELDSHTSYLNPLWFTGSLIIGTCSGLLGDDWNLGFLAETEYQVSAHLGSHLQNLPLSDHKSRTIVQQMQSDEMKHATTAIDHGAKTLPTPIKMGMHWMANVMKRIVYYV